MYADNLTPNRTLNKKQPGHFWKKKEKQGGFHCFNNMRSRQIKSAILSTEGI